MFVRRLAVASLLTWLLPILLAGLLSVLSLLRAVRTGLGIVLIELLPDGFRELFEFFPSKSKSFFVAAEESAGGFFDPFLQMIDAAAGLTFEVAGLTVDAKSHHAGCVIESLFRLIFR